MKKWSLVLLFINGMGLPAWSQTSSYDTQLMKLSRALKGEPPSLEERQQLEQAKHEKNEETFLKQITQKYLQDPKFSSKLKFKVDELFYLIPQIEPLSMQYNTSDMSPSSYNFFIQNIIDNNLNWDTLLTGKSYKEYFSPNKNNVFFRALDKNFSSPTDIQILLQEDSKISEITFSENEQRVAGIITTPRFFHRYANTALNKNRRRAAAVFRIFLCDSMVATAPPANSETEKRDFDILLPSHRNTEESIRGSLAATIHGEQADCMKCHYKLDPLGKVFALSQTTLGGRPSPGALRYQGTQGRKVDIPLQGFGDMAEQITRQPEYAECQVNHFWRWYVGQDVPISQDMMEDLVRVFNQVGRRPKDFIAHLTTLPEFKQKPLLLSQAQIISRRVSNLFKSCDSCHDSQGATIRSLSKFPYGSSREEIVETLNKVKESLDLDHGGMKKTMPPKESKWQLSAQDYTLIRRWLELG
ncbi:MAG: DUF1588 domain-containing protein, partial [Bdellovibrio sp.]